MANRLVLGSIENTFELVDGLHDQVVLEDLEEGLKNGETVPVYAKLNGAFQTIYVNPAAVPWWAVIIDWSGSGKSAPDGTLT